jgi:hypothetical protein
MAGGTSIPDPHPFAPENVICCMSGPWYLLRHSPRIHVSRVQRAVVHNIAQAQEGDRVSQTILISTVNSGTIILVMVFLHIMEESPFSGGMTHHY